MTWIVGTSITTNKSKTMGKNGGIISNKMYTSLPILPNDDHNEKMDNNFKNSGLEMNPLFGMKTVSLFTHGFLPMKTKRESPISQIIVM